MTAKAAIAATATILVKERIIRSVVAGGERREEEGWRRRGLKKCG